MACKHFYDGIFKLYSITIHDRGCELIDQAAIRLERMMIEDVFICDEPVDEFVDVPIDDDEDIPF